MVFENYGQRFFIRWATKFVPTGNGFQDHLESTKKEPGKTSTELFSYVINRMI